MVASMKCAKSVLLTFSSRLLNNYSKSSSHIINTSLKTFGLTSANFFRFVFNAIFLISRYNSNDNTGTIHRVSIPNLRRLQN